MSDSTPGYTKSGSLLGGTRNSPPDHQNPSLAQPQTHPKHFHHHCCIRMGPWRNVIIQLANQNEACFCLPNISPRRFSPNSREDMPVLEGLGVHHSTFQDISLLTTWSLGHCLKTIAIKYRVKPRQEKHRSCVSC